MKIFRILFSLPLLLSCVSLFAQAGEDTSSLAMAAVKYENKWAYIDKLGRIAIPGIFDMAGNFSEGRAAAQIASQWGYLSREGKWALKPVFSVAFPFNNNRAFVHFYDRADTFDHPIYIDRKGEFVHELAYGEDGFDYHDGLVRVGSGNINGPAIGFRDTMGGWAIKPRYDAAMDFSDGFAAVMLGQFWGFTDPKDNFLVFPKYEEVASFHEDYAWARDNKKQYFINTQGKTVLKLSASREVAPQVSDGLIAIREKGKVGFMNIRGKTVIKPQYENTFLPAFKEGLSPVKKDGKYGYIDKQGKTVIPFTYDEAFGFSEGLARIKMNGKFGFIDRAGKVIMPPRLDDAKDFSPTY